MGSFVRKPWVLLLAFWALHKCLDDLVFWVGLYLQSPSSQFYETVVWNYRGLSELQKDIFKHREQFVDLHYIVNRYWILLLYAAFAFLIIHYRDKAKTILHPGRTANWFTRTAAFLGKPNTPLFCIFVCLYLVLLHGFVDKIRLGYLVGVNQHLAKTITEYAEKRKAMTLAKYKRASSKQALELKEPICSFYASERRSISYRVSNLDFLYFFLTADGGPKKIEDKIKSLSPSLELVVDKSILDEFELNLKKETYSKEEVKEIVERDRARREIPSGPNYIDASKAYLLVSVENERFKLSLHEPDTSENLRLGTVELGCSRRVSDLEEFHMRPRWEMLQFFEDRFNNRELE